jgi:hypothetical protein
MLLFNDEEGEWRCCCGRQDVRLAAGRNRLGGGMAARFIWGLRQGAGGRAGTGARGWAQANLAGCAQVGETAAAPCG